MNKRYNVLYDNIRNNYLVVAKCTNGYRKRSIHKGKIACVAAMLSASFIYPLPILAEAVSGREIPSSEIHYYSVNATEQGENSNYDNQGATAKNSLVVGIHSSSEGINSTVIGNNNTLTGNKNNKNNSIVVGQGLEVDGVHNVVVGTNYENYDHKDSRVFGEQNTVLGVGNLVGWTAEQQESNWNYTKRKSRIDQVIVTGLTNTVNSSNGIVYGSSNEIQSDAQLAIAIGCGNTITGDSGLKPEENLFGNQYGMAIGRNLTAHGDSAIAIGNTSTAKGNSSILIGDNSTANGSYTIAIGGSAEALGIYSIANGGYAKAEGDGTVALGVTASATSNYSVALGSFSVSDRAAGSVGYDISGENHSDDDTGVWKSTLGAISVGDKEKKYTRQLTNVAAGVEDTDAVNVAQLKKVEALAQSGGGGGNVKEDGNYVKVANTLSDNILALDTTVKNNDTRITNLDTIVQDVSSHLGDLGNRINKIGAGSAALAALHPLDFNPNAKWDFSVGFGGYQNAHATAIGAFYRPNENTIISMGTNFGNGENMYNIGATFRLGDSTSVVSVSKVQLEQKILEQDQKLKEQAQKIELMEKQMHDMMSKIARL